MYGDARTYLITKQTYRALASVKPGTLLCQPPVVEADVRVEGGTVIVQNGEGVTFGDVVREVDRSRQRKEREAQWRKFENMRNGRVPLGQEEDYEEDLEADLGLSVAEGGVEGAQDESLGPGNSHDVMVRIEAKWVVAEKSKEVRRARRALRRA